MEQLQEVTCSKLASIVTRNQQVAFIGYRTSDQYIVDIDLLVSLLKDFQGKMGQTKF